MGAVIVAPLLAMGATALFTQLYGGFEGAAAMGGGALGGFAGIGGGLWLVLRKGGHWSGTAVTWLAVGAILMLACLGYVAFS